MFLSMLEHVTTTSAIQLDDSWKQFLEDEFCKDYMLTLKKFLVSEIQAGKMIFPKGSEYFSALNSTSFHDVKVVILGQDPYHGFGQAHGLSFSVKPGVAVPPSLVNIFKELKSDLEMSIPTSGFLLPWAKRGVLLLNSVLTVESSKAGSHQNKGWEIFTDKIIEVLNHQRENLAFILWGAYAQKKAKFVDRTKHFVLETVHPSPLSAHRGFSGSKPFSKVNAYLEEKGANPIDWSLP